MIDKTARPSTTAGMDIKTIPADRPPAPGYFRLIDDDGRFRVLDANGRRYRLRPERGTPVHAAYASAETSLTGANNDLVFSAIVAGVEGNGISIAYVISGTGSAAEVSVVDKAITITAGSACTADTVKAAIAASPAATLIEAVDKSGNDGSGAIIALSRTFLTGGSNATTASAGDQMFDDNALYTALANVESSSTSGWAGVLISAVSS